MRYKGTLYIYNIYFCVVDSVQQENESINLKFKDMKKDYRLEIVGYMDFYFHSYKHVMRAFYNADCAVNVYHKGVLIASKETTPIEYFLSI